MRAPSVRDSVMNYAVCAHVFLAFTRTTEQVKMNPKAVGCRTEARNIIRWCEMKTFRNFQKDGRFYAMPIRTMMKFAVLYRLRVWLNLGF